MLRSRIATAAVLLGAFLGALLFAPPWLWTVLCALALVAAAWEWGRLSRLAGAANAAFAALLVAAFLAVTALPAAHDWKRPLFGLATLFWVAGAPILLGRRTPPAGASLVATGMLALLAAFAALPALRHAGAGLLLALMSIVWIADTAAFFVGTLYGRHKLAPAISPGKTWEGVWGALAAVAIYAAALSAAAPGMLGPGYSRAGGTLFVAAALALAILGIVGDLFESRMKRAVGAKDSGRSLPGHGGLLDRIDALIPVLPAAAFLFGQ
jgi:phosphatidate cytidylyltransferase